MHSIRPDRLVLKKDNIIHCNSWSLKFGGNDVERNENKRWQRLPCLHYYIRLYTIIGIHTNNTMKYGELINKSDTYTHQNKSMFKIFVHNISYTKAQWHKKKKNKNSSLTIGMCCFSQMEKCYDDIGIKQSDVWQVDHSRNTYNTSMCTKLVIAEHNSYIGAD